MKETRTGLRQRKVLTTGKCSWIYGGDTTPARSSIGNG